MWIKLNENDGRARVSSSDIPDDKGSNHSVCLRGEASENSWYSRCKFYTYITHNFNLLAQSENFGSVRESSLGCK